MDASPDDWPESKPEKLTTAMKLPVGSTAIKTGCCVIVEAKGEPGVTSLYAPVVESVMAYMWMLFAARSAEKTKRPLTSRTTEPVVAGNGEPETAVSAPV